MRLEDKLLTKNNKIKVQNHCKFLNFKKLINKLKIYKGS
jgi:hypothetical protein